MPKQTKGHTKNLRFAIGMEWFDFLEQIAETQRFGNSVGDVARRILEDGMMEYFRRSQEYLRQLLFVDLPVVVGVGTLAVVSIMFLQDTTHSFEHGFRAGGVIVHIAMSQFIYVALIILSQRSRRRDYLSELKSSRQEAVR